jgi:hypothetical protein
MVTPLFEEEEDLTMEVGERPGGELWLRWRARKERRIHIRSGERESEK